MRLGIGIIDYFVGNRAGRRVRSLFEAIIWTWFSEKHRLGWSGIGNIDLLGRKSGRTENESTLVRGHRGGSSAKSNRIVLGKY